MVLRSILKIFNPGPVSARVEFEDRPYTLGGSMQLSIELQARREIEVEEARVDLECEEQWADTYVKMEPLGKTGGMLGRGKPMPGPAAPKRHVQVYTDTFVHSSVKLAGGIRLDAGEPTQVRRHAGHRRRAPAPRLRRHAQVEPGHDGRP